MSRISYACVSCCRFVHLQGSQLFSEVSYSHISLELFREKEEIFPSYNCQCRGTSTPTLHRALNWLFKVTDGIGIQLTMKGHVTERRYGCQSKPIRQKCQRALRKMTFVPVLSLFVLKYRFEKISQIRLARGIDIQILIKNVKKTTLLKAQRFPKQFHFVRLM